MCRVGGRRCPRHDEHRRLIESARQRLSRYSRLAAASTTPRDVERNGQLFQAALTDLESRTGISSSEPVPTPAPTRAGDYTWAKTAHWSDQELERALSTSWDDQQAVAAIEKLFDAREAVRGAVAASAPPDRAADVWAELEKQPHDLIERPGLREPKRLTAEQQARTDYETMKEVAYLQAEYECAGQLLKAKYRNSGIDPRSLWVGPVTRALKYASPELQSVWARSGRLTWGAFRYQALHRTSDRAEHERARTGKAFDDAIR